MANNITLSFDEQIREAEERIGEKEELLGKQLFQPFSNTVSGSRKILSSTNRDQVLPLLTPEVAILSTGFEDEFGVHSSSFMLADKNYRIIGKIPKFSFNSDIHYWLITEDVTSKELGVIERTQYKHITEAYGFILNNAFLDNLATGDCIQKGAVMQKSMAYDEYNNRMDGVNLRTAYISCDKTMEDGVVLSESGARKLTSPLIKVVNIIINDNDIMLNLYGDNDNYKTIPNIGEEIKNGIMCAVRRENKEESLFNQSISRLKEIMMSDEKYPVEGRVIDIDIYCNNPIGLDTSPYSQQLKFYYSETMKCYQNIVDFLNDYIEDYHFSYDLQKLYSIAKRALSGELYIKDRPFSNINMDIIVLEENKIGEGDKLCDRYGGKGVVSAVLKDELMPRLDNGDLVEIIYNSSTCVNRLNPGQLFETSLTHIGSRLIDFMKTQLLGVDECLDLIIAYIKSINDEEGQHLETMIDAMMEDDMIAYVGSIVEADGILLSLKPVTESMSIDDLARIYEEFDWAEPYYLTTPIEDSNGNIRYINSRRPIICGKKYIYRLKQYAEEKFSVTSLSSTNIRNQNSRSKMVKLYRGPFNKTPIKFGEMEAGDMAHLGMEYVIVLLMLYSSSPQARRLTEELLTGDPFNIDIKLDADSTSINVEILNAYFKTMGLRLIFDKIPKIKTSLFIKPLFIKEGKRLFENMSLVERETFDINEWTRRLLKENGVDSHLFERPLFIKDKNEQGQYE